MARKYIKSDGTKTPAGRVRPSERMFRRSRLAEHRRRISQKKDAGFTRIIFALVSFAILIVFAIVFFMTNAYAQEPEGTGLTKPVIGQYTGADIIGLIIVIILGFAVYKKFNAKK